MRAEHVLFKQGGESTLKDAALFLALFATFALAAFGLLSLTGKTLHATAAHSSSLVLLPLGIETEVAWDEASGFPHLLGSANNLPFDAEINELCAGAIELSVLFGIVFASRDRSLRQRLVGFAGGAALFLAFNPVRIALTLKMVGSWALPLVHDVLFRVSLVVLIVLYYGAWYYSTRSGKPFLINSP